MSFSSKFSGAPRRTDEGALPRRLLAAFSSLPSSSSPPSSSASPCSSAASSPCPPATRHPPCAHLQAVLLVGGFSTTLRPITLTTPLPLLDFCNVPLLMHQLRALKDAGVSEVLISVHERSTPASWDAYVRACEAELGITITCHKEDESLGTAGPLKAAEAMITSDGANASPFFVVNCDVLCSYPLKDLLHTHVQQKVEATVLTTRVPSDGSLSAYGVVVVDERTGRVRHFVEKPQTFVSDVINAGVCALPARRPPLRPRLSLLRRPRSPLPPPPRLSPARPSRSSLPPGTSSARRSSAASPPAARSR